MRLLFVNFIIDHPFSGDYPYIPQSPWSFRTFYLSVNDFTDVFFEFILLVCLFANYIVKP